MNAEPHEQRLHCFLTGAGVKRGFSYGESDDFGFKAAINKTTVYDFNAPLLHLMGLDHERLTFYHNGLERRLTNVHGHVVRDVLRDGSSFAAVTRL